MVPVQDANQSRSVRAVSSAVKKIRPYRDQLLSITNFVDRMYLTVFCHAYLCTLFTFCMLPNPLHPSTCKIPSYPLHLSHAHAHIIPATLLSYIYCLVSYPPHCCPAYTDCLHFLQPPHRLILPAFLPYTVLSCTYCLSSYSSHYLKVTLSPDWVPPPEFGFLDLRMQG